MRKLIIPLLSVALLFGSCTDKEKEQQEREQAEASKAELIAAVADRDQLLTLVNEISSGMEQIKQLENILTVSGGNETPGQKAQIQADIAAIQKTLQERREKLEELEKKLASSSKQNSALQQTITSLRSQIDSQSQEIASLRGNLSDATARIGSLDTAVTQVTAERDSVDMQKTQLANELNLCYYAIGTKAELKDNKIIETGFLRKTKLMKGDFDRTFFTVADKRTLTTIDLNSNKAEVLTNQPAGSYVISEGNGHKVLRITNPAAFWSLSNYLVIKID